MQWRFDIISCFPYDQNFWSAALLLRGVLNVTLFALVRPYERHSSSG
jgi:hypothetical protein